MDTVSAHYYRINSIFLKIIGLWPFQTDLSKRLGKLFVLVFASTHGYLQTAGMVAAWVDIDVFLEAIPTVLADVVCIVKFINFSYNAAMMKKLLIKMNEDWKMYTSGPENDILNDYARFGKKVTMYYAGALYGTMLPMTLVPLTPIVLDIVAPMNESYPKHLMYQQIEFLFDFEPYLYPLVIHGYIGTFAFLTIIIAIDTVFMVYIQHACARFAILGLYLDRVAKNANCSSDRHSPEFEEIDYKHMVICVSKHNDAIEFANLIEEANYFSFVFVIGINMLMMTTSGLVAAFKMDDPDVALKFVGFTIGEMFHLFYSSWQGEMLLEHSGNIFHRAYNSNWNYTSIHSQRIMVPLLMKSSRPCKLTAGKSFTMSIQSFSMVVKTSFSYLTVFTSMRG